MKRNFVTLIIIFLITVGYSYSQNGFIEVMVKDTIVLKPISYEFQVSSGLRFEYNYENPNSKEEFSKQLKDSEDKLTALLEKYGYDYKLNQNPEANIKLDITDKRNYLVKIKDPVQKEEFKVRMKQEGYDYYMTDRKFEDKNTKIREIYSRLLVKSKKRAELIAELSGNKIGRILEISESKSEFSIISSFIENFAYSRSYGATSTSFQFNTGVLEKSILVKYSIK